MKIHISNSSKEALDQLGGYITEHRGKVLKHYIKNRFRH